MNRLTLDEHDVSELTALLTLVGEDGGPVLPWAFLRRLKDFIGCDCLGINGVDSVERRWYFDQEPDDEGDWFSTAEQCAAEQLEDDPFWTHYWDCLPCGYPDITGESRTVTAISDFYSQRRWLAHPMYLDVFRGEDFRHHEMMLCLPDGVGRTFRLLCFRGPGSDFGERERFLLTLLRPHIEEAYRAAQRRQTTASLTPRQKEVLALVGEGFTNRQIGRRLHTSEDTARTHVNNIFVRLGVTSRTAAVAKAMPEHQLASTLTP